MAKAEARYTISAKDETARGIASAERRMLRLGDVARRVARWGAVAAGAVTAGFIGAAAATQRVANSLDNVAKAARDMGVSGEMGAVLKLMADLAGVDLTRLVAGFERLDQVVARAARGDKAARLTFQRLGLDPEQLGATRAEQLVNIAGALQTLPTRAQRTESRRELFGRGMGRLFEGGPAGIVAALEEGLRLRVGEGAEGVQGAAERMNDAATKLEAAAEGVAGRALEPVMEGAAVAMETVADAIAAGERQQVLELKQSRVLLKSIHKALTTPNPIASNVAARYL